MPMPLPPIEGRVDPRFEAVREAFAANFAEGEELGAAVAVRVDGRPVVDLWGGHRDRARTRPWKRDTVVNAWSVGKGILTMLVLAAVERGELDLDRPVRELWPEFAVAGKAGIRVRTLLAHAAGLPSVRRRLPPGSATSWEVMTTALASEAPWWEPGAGHGYHVNTFGFLVGEVLRRSTGEPVSRVLRQRLTGPAGASFWFGLPPDQEHRAAEVDPPDLGLETEAEWARIFPPSGDAARDRMVWHAYFNPPELSGLGSVNTRAWRSAVIPSANGHGTARAVAGLYDFLLRGAPGVPPPVGSALLAEATTAHADGEDRVLGRRTRFGLGFQLPHPERPLGRGEGSFGHHGYGGSLGFADPEAGLAFAYLANRPGDRWRTPRTRRLVEAVYACLGAVESEAASRRCGSPSSAGGA